MKRFLYAVFLILFSAVFLIGGVCVAWPFVSSICSSYETEQAVEEFNNLRETISSDDETPMETVFPTTEAIKQETDAPESSTTVPYSELLEMMQDYNNRIYTEKQVGLCDAWSYTQTDFDLTDWGCDDEVFGYIEIPSMNSTMPIYLGASSANMAKGAVVLGQTSIPIGGINTNAVIACHRGWKHAAYWRDIEDISVGDYVYLTNLWTQMTYQVTEIQIIYPDEVSKVLIQDGKDMLTLITCHPYGGHGKYRYVVYCERTADISASISEVTSTEVPSASAEIESTPISTSEPVQYIQMPDGTEFESSKGEIQSELIIQRLGLFLISLSAITLLAVAVHYSRQQPHGKRER